MCPKVLVATNSLLEGHIVYMIFLLYHVTLKSASCKDVLNKDVYFTDVLKWDFVFSKRACSIILIMSDNSVAIFIFYLTYDLINPIDLFICLSHCC